MEFSRYKPTFVSGKFKFLDIVGSLLALIVFSPVFLVLSLLIKNRDGGSAFFAQERIGK
ncbi:sugar transferase, partial [Lactobacillus delbrueckii]